MRKNTLSLTRQTLYVLGASFGLGLAFDTLFFGKLPGISFPIYIFLILGALFLLAVKTGVKIPKQAAFALAPLVFFAWMVFVRANPFLTFLNIVASIYLLGLFVSMVFKPNLRTYNFVEYLEPLYRLPIDTLGKSVSTLSAMIERHRTLSRYKISPQVLRGAVVTIPVVLLFVALFASADLVFRKYLTETFDFKISEELLPRTLPVLMVTFIFVGVLGYLIQKSEQKQPQATTQAKPRAWSLVETTILFSSLNVLFLGFIILQLTYLFGGQQNITGQGFTYAEYARKGFFELIAVAVLTFALITAAEKILLSKSDSHAPRFKLLAGALIAQVLVIMVSAFNRLSLYENAYGFTTLRLYSHIFLIWLAVVFCIVLYKILANKKENAFAFLTFLSVVAALAFVNILNVDAFVARKNIGRFYQTGKIDAQYLTHLSDDAIGESVQLLDAPKFDTKDKFAGWLCGRYEALQSDKPWQSTNLASEKALNDLETRKRVLEKNKGSRFKTRIFKYY